MINHILKFACWRTSWRESLRNVALILVAGLCASAASGSQDAANTVRPEPFVNPDLHVNLGAAVRLTHDYDGVSRLGAVETIQIDLKEDYARGRMTVSVRESPGLEFYSDLRDHSFSMADDAEKSFTIHFEAKTEGQHYLNLLTTVELEDGQTLQHPHHISVQVGEQSILDKQQVKSAVMRGASGETVVMEAKETITD